MNTKRAIEIINKGYKKKDWDTHITNEEMSYISNIWEGMDEESTWFDALVKIACVIVCDICGIVLIQLEIKICEEWDNVFKGKYYCFFHQNL